MTEALEVLIYVSQPRPGLDEDELAKLMEVSRRRNETDRITGALLKYAGHFVQVLEGPPEAVDACFDRICADPRHFDIELLMRGPLPLRRFERWSMRRVPAPTPGDRAVESYFTELTSHRAAPASVVPVLEALSRRPDSAL